MLGEKNAFLSLTGGRAGISERRFFVLFFLLVPDSHDASPAGGGHAGLEDLLHRVHGLDRVVVQCVDAAAAQQQHLQQQKVSSSA